MMVSRQLEQVLLVYYQLWRTSPFSVLLLQPQHPREELVEDLFLGTDRSPELHYHHKSNDSEQYSAENHVFFRKTFQDFPG